MRVGQDTRKRQRQSSPRIGPRRQTEHGSQVVEFAQRMARRTGFPSFAEQPSRALPETLRNCVPAWVVKQRKKQGPLQRSRMPRRGTTRERKRACASPVIRLAANMRSKIKPRRRIARTPFAGELGWGGSECARLLHRRGRRTALPARELTRHVCLGWRSADCFRVGRIRSLPGARRE